MITSFLSVAQQVLILFILLMVGLICTKKNFFTEEFISGISKFLLYTVTPCVIVNSFNREYDPTMLTGLGISFLAALGIHIFCIIITHLFMKDSEESRQIVLRFGTVFSNCGYMALPLQQAILGSEGVFYGAAFIAVFNLVNWTYGLFLMGGKETKITAKKIFINPGVIGICIGLLLFLTPVELPTLILTPVQSLAALNTPLPMLIIGYYMAKITSFSVLKDKKLVLSIFLRLVFLPLCVFGILYACGLRGTLFTSMVIAASAPTAANTVVFSAMFKRDSSLAVAQVAISTLFSILTMPLIVSLTMIL